VKSARTARARSAASCPACLPDARSRREAPSRPSYPAQSAHRAGVQVLINNNDMAQGFKIRGEEIENSHKTFAVKQAQSAFITITHVMRYSCDTVINTSSHKNIMYLLFKSPPSLSVQKTLTEYRCTVPHVSTCGSRAARARSRRKRGGTGLSQMKNGHRKRLAGSQRQDEQNGSFPQHPLTPEETRTRWTLFHRKHHVTRREGQHSRITQGSEGGKKIL